MSTTLTVIEAQTKLSQLLKLARAGHDVIIQDPQNGKARLMPVSEPPTGPRVLGLHDGSWSVAPEFDAALPESFWLCNEGR